MGTSLDTSADSTTGNGSPTGTALSNDHRPHSSSTRPYQRLADERRGTGGEHLADFLGYFSIGLGLAEFVAPTLMARLIGVKHPTDRTRNTMRLMGIREFGNGIAILSKQQPTEALWARVAGDALDLALLGRTLANPENDRGRTLFATANVLAVAALDVMAAKQLSRQPETPVNEEMQRGMIQVRKSITVRKPVDEVYGFWHDFENLPRFMRHLVSVTETSDRRSHWVAKAPAGKTVEWDAEVVDDQPNELISWRSLPGADVYNAGEVRFNPAPGDRGTEVRVTMEYHPPMGKLGSKVAMLFREEPGQQVQDDLRHFKQVMETGEIVFSDATKRRGMHPAQPDNKPVEL